MDRSLKLDSYLSVRSSSEKTQVVENLTFLNKMANQAKVVLENLGDMIGKISGDQQESFLESMVSQACDPSFAQPNLSLNLQICDMINKKRSTMYLGGYRRSRDAAFCIVRYVNRVNPTSAFLALSLLDICIKNCGYPFHLVISSKEFLNEIVRKFTDNPRVFL